MLLAEGVFVRTSRWLIAAALLLLGSAPALSGAALAESDSVRPRLAPSKLKVDIAHARAVLNWQTPADDASSLTSYQILRRHPGIDPVGDFDVVVENTAGIDNMYVDADLLRSQVFTYRVRAWRGDQLSSWSNYKRINLNVPSNLSASLVGKHVTLT